jgi:glycosyltransferase involved in cell wall biosynthesis
VDIVHVTPHLPPDQGANALLPAALGRWQAARGARVSFVAHAPAQGRTGPTDVGGPVTWIARRSPSSLARRLRVSSWQTARAVTRALAALPSRPDVVHLHSNGVIIEAASRWARSRRVPSVLTLYGTEIWHYRRRAIDPFRAAYLRAGAVAFYSERLRDRASEIGLDRPNLSVVYPAVDPSFAPCGDEARRAMRAALGIEEPIVVLNVKRLHELAGQKFLIEAFAHVARARRDVRLVICGVGPLRGPLEEQARNMRIAHRVTFAGLVPNETVAQYAAVADIFVLPSLLEALPTVAVEALAAGTPVISADHPGGIELHELFGDDVELVPKQDAARLADALAAALDRPRRVVPRTLELVAARFSPAAVQRAYDKLYASVRA